MKDNRLLEMRVFKACVDHGTFSAAAIQLGADQPFVSRTIACLEKRLGVALLNRSTRRMQVTAEGETFLESCRRVLEEIDQVEGELSHLRAEPEGDIRVTAPTSFGLDRIVPLLPAFLDRHPRVRVRLSLSDVVADIIESGFDVAIRMGQLKDSRYVSRRLCHLQRIVVASPGYLARHGEPKTPGDLHAHNCLQWDASLEHLNRWPFVVDGEPVEFDTRGSFFTISGVSAVELTKAGVCVSRMAEHIALPLIRRGELVPLLQDFQRKDDTWIHVVFVKKRREHARLQAFLDYVVESFDPPPWAVGEPSRAQSKTSGSSSEISAK